jgi:urease accessory protein
MGATAIRISASDFVIPPALRHWRLAAEGAGRIGGVRLELNAGPDGARLGACYQQTPLRVLPPFPFSPGQPSLLYLLNPTAGLMDGDGQKVELQARPGARAVVVGQSATRIHPALRGLCTQQWQVHVARGATLVVLPGPAIPFQGCRYYQRVEVDLEEGAGLIWGDVWLAGRYACGRQSERFRFEFLRQDFLIRRSGRLIFRDHFDWRGPWDDATAEWHFGGADASGSLFATAPAADSFPPAEVGAEGGCFRTAARDFCYRWRGPSEAVADAVVRTALAFAPMLTDIGSGAWLSGHELAPCHWFSRAAADASGP